MIDRSFNCIGNAYLGYYYSAGYYCCLKLHIDPKVLPPR